MIFKKKINAFSLTELLIVLVIMGILILLALPELMPLIAKAHSMEAKSNLKMVHTLQKTHFYEYSKFSDDLSTIGYEQQVLVTEDGGSAKYLIEMVEKGANSFIARATAVVDFDGDGTYNVWEIDEKGKITEIIKD
ncbi:MAG: type II secretion system GspH family protein [Carboxylicivirga sp.]|jgi:type IV pilus assembly protein PilE|nr:type II secretion system GspH family protein [Carboxylicivirga sp.]